MTIITISRAGPGWPLWRGGWWGRGRVKAQERGAWGSRDSQCGGEDSTWMDEWLMNLLQPEVNWAQLISQVGTPPPTASGNPADIECIDIEWRKICRHEDRSMNFCRCSPGYIPVRLYQMSFENWTISCEFSTESCTFLPGRMVSSTEWLKGWLCKTLNLFWILWPLQVLC